MEHGTLSTLLSSFLASTSKFTTRLSLISSALIYVGQSNVTLDTTQTLSANPLSERLTVMVPLPAGDLFFSMSGRVSFLLDTTWQGRGGGKWLKRTEMAKLCSIKSYFSIITNSGNVQQQQQHENIRDPKQPLTFGVSLHNTATSYQRHCNRSVFVPHQGETMSL